MRSTKPNGWSNDYHSFVLNRTPENIVFKIDGESSILDTSNIPLDIIFDSEVKTISFCKFVLILQ